MNRMARNPRSDRIAIRWPSRMRWVSESPPPARSGETSSSAPMVAPIAAAFDYERSIQREELVLIVDIGGGTTEIADLLGRVTAVSRPLVDVGRPQQADRVVVAQHAAAHSRPSGDLADQHIPALAPEGVPVAGHQRHAFTGSKPQPRAHPKTGG